MPRPPRLDLPDVPQHLRVRGNNRAALFFTENDRQFFVRYLDEGMDRYGCELHAFVLMGNHVHLLATPRRSLATSRMIQSVGRRYCRYFNRVHGRTGTVFEGRFRSSVIDTGDYLLTCMRYIEANPVRAGLAAHPRDYAWSSFAANASGEPAGRLTPRPEYLALGADAAERARAYRELSALPLDAPVLDALRQGLDHDRPTGSNEFVARLGAAVGRVLGLPRRGRPRVGKSNLTPFFEK